MRWTPAAQVVFVRTRARARWMPAVLLRRRERRIVARVFPTCEELAALGAIRRELRVRSTRRAPRPWRWPA